MRPTRDFDVIWTREFGAEVPEPLQLDAGRLEVRIHLVLGIHPDLDLLVVSNWDELESELN